MGPDGGVESESDGQAAQTDAFHWEVQTHFVSTTGIIEGHLVCNYCAVVAAAASIDVVAEAGSSSLPSW